MLPGQKGLSAKTGKRQIVGMARIVESFTSLSMTCRIEIHTTDDTRDCHGRQAAMPPGPVSYHIIHRVERWNHVRCVTRCNGIRASCFPPRRFHRHVPVAAARRLWIRAKKTVKVVGATRSGTIAEQGPAAESGRFIRRISAQISVALWESRDRFR